MKKNSRASICLSILLCCATGAYSAGSPRLGFWSSDPGTPRASSFVLFPVFSFERILPSASADSVSFGARLTGLDPGVPYAVWAPYASSLTAGGSGSTVKAGGRFLAIVAEGADLELSAAVAGPGALSGIDLRGAAVRPLALVPALLGGFWLLLVLSVAGAAVRAALGFRAALRDKSRTDEAYFALASCALFLLAAAAFRLASIPAFEPFSSDLESRLRSLGGILFALAAAGGIAASKPFRGAFAFFMAFVLLGAAASFAVALPSMPAALPLAAFAGAASLAFLGAGVVSFAFRRHADALLSAAAFVGTAALCLSSIAVDPALETILSLAAPLPFLAATLRTRPIPELPAEAEPVLSDYVDQVSVALTRFVPKEFLAILDKDDASMLKLGDHIKKDMTIFFSDIRSFTTLSEGLTPEENFKFINSYLARVVPVVNAHGGFVDKYIGDAIMALFPSDNGADEAVLASIEMQKRIVEYNGHRANCGYRPLSMGIGLHTGTLMLGVVGVEDRMQSTVISDAVNLASRLESITKVFNVSLAISEETFKSLADPGAYMYRFIGKVRVKGKIDPVSVFEIFDGVDEALFDRKMKANRFFEQGMLAYYQKDFPGAMFYFRKVLEVLPEDGASTFYLDNCLAKARV